MRKYLVPIAVAALALSFMPASADTTKRDIPALVSQAHDRFVPKAAGTEEDLSFLYGPYTIGPGQDRNLITGEIPLTNVHLTAVAPDLVDAADGSIPTEQEAHIHHAHWFQLTEDAGDRSCYTTIGSGCLAWVFGTGEEKTQGRFTDRADVVPEGVADPLTDPAYQTRPHYGIYVAGDRPQALIFMIHNKTPSPMKVYVVLDVTVIHGNAEQIEAATGRPMHTVEGTLWGETKDATAGYPFLTREYTFQHGGTAIAAGSHVHPGGKEVFVTNLGPDGMCRGTDPDADGYPGVTILNSQKWDRVPGATPYSEDYQMGATKFGWRAPVHPGDVLAQYAPYAIHGGSRAALDNGLKGLANPATFWSEDGLDHAWYEGMSYTGIYIARDDPAPGLPEIERDGDGEITPESRAQICTTENFAVDLVGEDDFRTQGWSAKWPVNDPRIADLRDRFVAGTPTAGMINHLWVGSDADPLCGPGLGDPCELHRGTSDWSEVPTDAIHITGFRYTPGDLASSGPAAQMPLVQQGGALRFVNEDAALGMRHSATSCPAPCDGPYVANYPAPDGLFDTGKLGNTDYIDGGMAVGASVEHVLGEVFEEDSPIWSEIPWDDDPSGQFDGDPRHHETLPYYTLEIDERFTPGETYTYFCRLHPSMRGAFKVATA